MPYSPEDYWPQLYASGKRKNTPFLSLVCNPTFPPLANRFLNLIHRRVFIHLLARIPVPAGSLALDLGCGGGRWSKLLRSRDFLVWGMDRVPLALPRVCNSGMGFAVSRVQALGVAHGCATLVNIVTVLQHLPYPEQELAMDEITRILAPGGHLLLLENITPGEIPGRAVNWEGVYPRSGREWRDAVTGRGFTLVAERKFQYLPLLGWYITFKQFCMRAYLRTQGKRNSSGAISPAGPSAWPGPPPRIEWKPAIKSFLAVLDALLINSAVFFSLPFEWRLGSRHGSHLGIAAVKAKI